MKELSIEEKAKAYDEAIRKAFIAYKDEDKHLKATLERIFPEFCESEDEKIRKEIIDFIDTKTIDSDERRNKWFSYLKKQSEPININPSEFDLRLNKLLKQFETLSKEELISSLNFYLNVVQNNGTYKSDEKQGEQKSADKIEPKFKVGDWVMLDRPVLITKVEDMPYNTHQYWTSDGTWFGDATKAKLWTIQDAKDGDVLIDSLGNVCIYQEPSTKLMYHSHCYGNHKYFIYMGGSHEIVGSYPATKDQRDQFEKAMTDAGYAFDFDKKELKKIEDEEYDGDDYGIDSLWHAKNILEKTLGKVDGYQTDDGILDHKCAITAVDKLYKNSIAWIEKDKHWMQKAIDFMNHPDLIKATPTLAKDTINWLKSLKDRVQPQSKQEWSEENESNFQGIIDELKANKHHAPDSDLPTYDRFLSWFKSLKERYVWKPSDEQIDALEHFIRSIGESGFASPYDDNTRLLYSLLEQLKKL